MRAAFLLIIWKLDSGYRILGGVYINRYTVSPILFGYKIIKVIIILRNTVKMRGRTQGIYYIGNRHFIVDSVYVKLIVGVRVGIKIVFYPEFYDIAFFKHYRAVGGIKEGNGVLNFDYKGHNITIALCGDMWTCSDKIKSMIY